MRHLDLRFKLKSTPPWSQRLLGSSREVTFTLAGFQNSSSAAYPLVESSSSLTFVLFCYSPCPLLSLTDFLHYDSGTSSLSTQFVPHTWEMSTSTWMMPPIQTPILRCLLLPSTSSTASLWKMPKPHTHQVKQLLSDLAHMLHYPKSNSSYSTIWDLQYSDLLFLPYSSTSISLPRKQKCIIFLSTLLTTP